MHKTERLEWARRRNTACSIPKPKACLLDHEGQHRGIPRMMSQLLGPPSVGREHSHHLHMSKGETDWGRWPEGAGVDSQSLPYVAPLPFSGLEI